MEEKLIQGVGLLTNRIAVNYWEQPIGNFIGQGTDNANKNFSRNLEKGSLYLIFQTI